MPSAGLLRQKLLSLFDEQIIPDIRERGIADFKVAFPPPAPSGHTSTRALDLPPLRLEDAVNAYPAGPLWEDENVHPINFPMLKCLIKGEIDLRIGVTVDMAADERLRNEPRGVYIVSMAAPSYLLIPPGVPVSSGANLPWERLQVQPPSLVLSARFLPTGCLCHLTSIHDDVYEAGYSLMVEDAYLAPMIELLLDELTYSAPQAEIARSQLMVLLLRLQRGLRGNTLFMTDGLHSRFPARPGSASDREDEAEGRIFLRDASADTATTTALDKAYDFIQYHLHETLSPARIAHHVRLKPSHLNRLFQQEMGLSVMRYVTQRRIETAKLLLETSELSVQEISLLVGYKYSSHFSRAFQRHVGASPLKFRQQKTHSHYSRHT